MADVMQDIWDDTRGAVWMTYGELAAARNIKQPGERKNPQDIRDDVSQDVIADVRPDLTAYREAMQGQIASHAGMIDGFGRRSPRQRKPRIRPGARPRKQPRQPMHSAQADQLGWQVAAWRGHGGE